MQIIQIGNPILSKPNSDITEYSSKEFHKIIEKMISVMREKELVGIAANQIGINKNIFMTEVRNTSHRKTDTNDDLRIFINPKIISLSEKMETGYEGCGSVAYSELFGEVKRHREVLIEYNDVKGVLQQLEAKDFLARVIQHEMDHLKNITFIEKITDMKTCMSGGEFRKLLTNK